jgi:plasmid stabilization system protein ParE
VIEYEIVLTESAESDIDDEFHFWLLISPDFAASIREKVDEAIRSLRIFPHRYAFAPEDQTTQVGARNVIVGTGRAAYRLIYAIIEGEEGTRIVRILRLRHTSRGPLLEADDDSSTG